MKTILHKADTRGHAQHGWLDSYHTFSFARYYNPERVHFGALRVLNDDTVAPGQGFGTHPHDNMEIISIPLSGDLEHKDSMGNVSVIREGDIQVLSAGTGITHSEYNKNRDREVKFLQIWVFPNRRDVEPRYDQMKLPVSHEANTFHQVLSPDPADEGVWIHQNAWFHIGTFDRDGKAFYSMKDPMQNGVYIFVLEGKVQIGDQVIETRDGFGIWEVDAFEVKALESSRLLIMEVPMQLPKAA